MGRNGVHGHLARRGPQRRVYAALQGGAYLDNTRRQASVGGRVITAQAERGTTDSTYGASTGTAERETTDSTQGTSAGAAPSSEKMRGSITAETGEIGGRGD